MEITLKVDSDLLFPIGTHLYVPASNDWRTFNEVCPVCGGSKKVTIKGYEIACGYCSCGVYSSIDDKQHLTIRNFFSEEYIINSIELKGTEAKSDYKSGDYPALYIKSLYGFCRGKKGLSSIENKNFIHTHEDRINLDLTRENVGEIYHHISDLVYTSKALADKAAKALHEYQHERLVRFNAEHGTAYEYPWEY